VPGETPYTPLYVAHVNYNHGQTDKVIIDRANVAIQLPPMLVPEGVKLVLRADPFNIGVILVAFDQKFATDPQYAEPLQADQYLSYAIRDASIVWISGGAINDILHLTAERGA
jgi:hypothetical protein